MGLPVDPNVPLFGIVTRLVDQKGIAEVRCRKTFVISWICIMDWICMAEALFKAFAKALDMAVCPDQRIRGVLSTKGTI